MLTFLMTTTYSCIDESEKEPDSITYSITLHNTTDRTLTVTRITKEGESILYSQLNPNYFVDVYMIAGKDDPQVIGAYQQGGALYGSTVTITPEDDDHYDWNLGESTISGGSGNPDGNCSLDNYEGPEFDIQVDAQCKAAYIYECSGNQAGVDAACEIYRMWQAQNPNIPDCPYCN